MFCFSNLNTNETKFYKNIYTFAYLNLENLILMYNIYIVSIVQKQNKDEQERCGS